MSGSPEIRINQIAHNSFGIEAASLQTGSQHPPKEPLPEMPLPTGEFILGAGLTIAAALWLARILKESPKK